jgi:hypothetical protein
MKKQTLIACMIAIATFTTVKAQTIALHTASGVQIIKGNTALATAYALAQNEDTLYLSGGSFTPPAAFDKQLMVFGAGHYADSTVATGKTFINGSVTLSENADLFYMEGVEITASLIFTDYHAVNNVSIKRCKINSTTSIAGNLNTPTTNLSLIGNVFLGHVAIENAQNVMITNNIFQGGLFNSNGNLISNNIFLGQFWIGAWASVSGNNNQINNNYFPGNYPVSGDGNTYDSNLFVSGEPYYGTNFTATNSYLNATLPFVDQSGSTFSYLNNYHLQSPATYTGNDGSQVCIYGGTFPYKEGAVPLNPHIQIKNIAPTTDASGNLQIQIQVAAQND